MAKQSATANTQDAPVDIQPSVKEMHDLPLVLVIVVTAIFVMSVGIYIDRPYKGNASYLIGFSLIAFVYIGAFIRKAEGLMSRALWLWCGFGAIIFLIPTFISAMGWWGLNDKEVADMIITSLTWLLLPTCFLWMNKSAKTMEKERVKRNQDALREVGGSSSILCNITLKHLHALPTRLYGQETAERTLLKAAKAHDGMGGKPFSAVFCGASGVGKTQLAENLSRVLGMPLIQFNMGEISSGTGMDNSPGCESRLGRNSGKDVLIGMPTGYVGAEKGGLLTNALKRNRKGIFLFDEMEKAGSGIYDLFLNCLDKGWINDARGNRYDCSEATFIFTTNVARDVDPALPEAKIKDKMIRAGFRPELMGRINKAVVFKPLTPDVARDLTIQMFKSMGKSVALKSNKTLPTVEWKPQKAAVDFFLNDLGYEVYGVRAIQKAVKELWQEVMAKDAHKVVFYPCRHKAPKLAKGEIAIALGTAEPIDLAAMRKHVLAKVKGQDHAMDTIIDQLEIREMGMVAKAEQPEGTFLFTGPSGTGKTEMVKQVADFLGRKFIIFNMGNFKGENGVEAFFGPPPGYTGSEKGGQLTQAILDHPDAIILLDEIEKAHPKIWDAFMSIFDDGMAKDTSSGEEVAFNKTMIFMTSNILTKAMPDEQVRDYLRESGYFRPEMVNRIEHIVSFKALADDVKEDIVRKVIAGIIANYNKTNGTELEVREAWVTRFAGEADFANGVRDIQRKVQRELMRELKEAA